MCAWFKRLARRKKEIQGTKIQTFLVVNFLKSQGTTFIKIGSISHFLSRKYLSIEFDWFTEKENKNLSKLLVRMIHTSCFCEEVILHVKLYYFCCLKWFLNACHFFPQKKSILNEWCELHSLISSTIFVERKYVYQGYFICLSNKISPFMEAYCLKGITPRYCQTSKKR